LKALRLAQARRPDLEEAAQLEVVAGGPAWPWSRPCGKSEEVVEG